MTKRLYRTTSFINKVLVLYLQTKQHEHLLEQLKLQDARLGIRELVTSGWKSWSNDQRDKTGLWGQKEFWKKAKL